MSDEELNKLDFYFYKLEMVDELESMIKDSDIDFTGKIEVKLSNNCKI